MQSHLLWNSVQNIRNITLRTDGEQADQLSKRGQNL